MSSSAIQSAIAETSPMVDAGSFYVPKNKQSRLNAIYQTESISARALPSGVFSNPVEIVFQASQLQRINLVDKWTLQLNIANPNVLAASLVSTHWLVSSIGVYSNGQPLETINNFQLWLKEINHTDFDDYNFRGDSHNYTASTAGVISAGPGIAGASSATYYLEFDTCLERAELPYRLNNSLIEFRIQMASGALIWAGAAGLAQPTLNSATLLCNGWQVSQQELLRQKMKLAQKGFALKTAIRRNVILNPGTMAASTQYTQTLSSFTGGAYFIQVFTRDQTAANGLALMTGWQVPSVFSLLDSGGVPYGIAGLNVSYQQLVVYPRLFPKAFIPSSATNCTIMIPFSVRPDLSEHDGIDSGFASLENAVLQITTGLVTSGNVNTNFVHIMQPAILFLDTTGQITLTQL